MHNKKNQLGEAVGNLPEIYQPIFGHSELSADVSRTCEDRLARIVEIYKVLEEFYGRPLNVLDLGCAQGFFCFKLARLGAKVTGVDYLDQNVKLCNLLAEEHSELNVSFTLSRIEDYLANLEPGQYDLVLGLSVFHHMVHENSLVYVQTLLGDLAKKAPVGVFELALNTEPLYWAESLPSDPRDILAEFAFVHHINHIKTHLSDVERPLVFASNKFWYLEGRLEKFDLWTSSSHNLAPNVHGGTRRYYFSETFFLKHFEINHIRSKHNLPEITKEIEFHHLNLGIGRSPKLILSGCTEDEGWVVTERLDGRLLLDLIQEDSKIDHYYIIKNVLVQLVELEKRGLYHNDVRIWNIMILEDGFPQLIDFGSVSGVKKDCQWPTDLFLSFMIFIHEVVNFKIEPAFLLRPIAIHPASMPEYYQAWAYALWQINHNDWSFSGMLSLLEDLPILSKQVGREAPFDLWFQSIEEIVSLLAQQLQNVANDSSKGEMRGVMPQLITELAEVRLQMNELQKSHQQWETLCCEYEHEFQKIKTSTSWKVTAPLRKIKNRTMKLQDVVSRRKT